MSQSRKRAKRSSKNYNKKNLMSSQSEDVLNKLDGLRTNIKQEQKNITVSSSNMNVKIIAVLIIIIVSGAGLYVLYSPSSIPNVSGSNTAGTSKTQSLAGNFKKDLLATPLFINKKISFIYVGGLYCPDCAMERWAIVMALSHYGNFSGLSNFYSAQDKIPTYNFTKASYTSSLVDFQSIEVYDNTAPPNQKVLQPLSGTPKTLFVNYANHDIPFICIAGSIYQSGAGPSLNLKSFTGQSLSAVQSQVNSKSGTYYNQILTESNIIVQIINQELGLQTSNTSTASTTNTTS